MYVVQPPVNPNVQGVPSGASYTVLENRAVYKTEIDRFNAAMVVADANIANDVKIATAFTALQSAENARGTPAGESAYEKARIAYYTLTKGASWADDEKRRIADVEAQPVVDDFITRYAALQEKRTQQASTIEVINGLKDRVLSVKDDLAFSVNTFQRQIEAVKNRINIDKKNNVDSIHTTTSWFDTVLNWLIAISTIICILLLIRRFAFKYNPLQGELNILRARTGFYDSLLTDRAAAEVPRPIAPVAPVAAK